MRHLSQHFHPNCQLKRNSSRCGCRKYFTHVILWDTCVGPWRPSSCLGCPFPLPHLYSAVAPSSPPKASHFPPSLCGSSPSPEKQKEDLQTDIFIWHKHLIIGITWCSVVHRVCVCVTLCERLAANTRSFSSFWMTRSLCAVTLRKTCLAWRSLVLCWLCFSLYFLVSREKEVNHRKVR